MTAQPGGPPTSDSPPTELLIARFPDPPSGIRGTFEALHIAANTPSFDEANLSRLEALPRPWDPATCPGGLRAELWTWLDEVAGWINTEHLWTLQISGVPACWPAHPHIAHDLAVIASSRYLTTYAVSPGPLEEWHRYALPAFLNRLNERLGIGCVAEHQRQRPRAPRDQDFVDSTQVHRRIAQFRVDADHAVGNVTR